ncbi:hypothetical protein AR438_11025 [Chryseobacterium aquaticum]|uniref:Uncharacterized protein n=1 Tax=Chryseobacterium aquaticum TaxID=452084 RepID=A0A0Q3LSE8_9FLAO|nr:hypothetical protein [Chryseobacterium aquaticum]KQK26105.1 hypothetical protein AR438_11025 [Chryseobacterium aquaticum]
MDKSLNSFVDFLIDQKKLRFSVDEFPIDTALINNGIVKIENGQGSISDFGMVTKSLLEKYMQRLNISIGRSFEENVQFIADMEKDFICKGFTSDYLELEKEIWRLIIKESNDSQECSFSEYLNSIDPDNLPEGFYQFMEAYSILLPELNLSEDDIIDNFFTLTDVTKSETQYSLDLDNVLNGISRLCKNDYDRGLSLLQKSLDHQNRKDILISAVVTGLFENKGSQFYRSILKKLIAEKKNQIPVFFGLSNVTNPSDTDCELFIDLIKEYRGEEKITTAILSLAFSVLKTKHSTYHPFCLQELDSAVVNESAAYYILHNINRTDISKDKKTDLIVKLIHQDYFSTEKYITQIARSVRLLKDLESFKKIMMSIIGVSPYTHFIKKFQTFLQHIDKTEIDKLIIELLTDNAASKRFIGLEIFHEMSRLDPYRFTLDILTLAPISQYKLWMALTGDFHQPKDRLTALLPLLNSESELVRESFLCKLEEISEDYGGQVLDILVENLVDDNPDQRTAMKRIKNYISDFYDRHTIAKNALSEINPYQTHSKYIIKFNYLFHKNMNKSIDRGAREDSFLSLLGANTVQLSKGGGYRFGPKKEIAQLGSFASSFTMPRSYFIDPNQYDMEIGMLIRQDWKDEEFAELLKVIENE